MTFSPPRALVFGAIGLPVGFILTAFVLAVTEQDIAAPTILPWALGVMALAALVGGFTTPKE